MNNPVQFFTSSHGRIAYTDTQTGSPALILVHGLPTAKELWHPVHPHLTAGYRVIAFDINGYGESEKTGRPISHQERADVLDELRKDLGVSRFILIGHDLGASVAVDYMGKYADYVDKLVLISPPVYPDFQEPIIVKLVRTRNLGEILVFFIQYLLFRIGIQQGLVHKSRYTPPLQAAFTGAFRGRAGRAALLRVLRWGRPRTVFAEYPSIIRSIQASTLVIQGQHDPYIPAKQAQRLALDVPNAKLHIIPDGAHFLPIDTPKKVAQAINAFIQ